MNNLNNSTSSNNRPLSASSITQQQQHLQPQQPLHPQQLQISKASPKLSVNNATSSSNVGVIGSLPLTGSSLAIKPSPVNSNQMNLNRGRWCAMHVRVAWEIYSQQQRLVNQSGSNVSPSSSLRLFRKSPKPIPTSAPGRPAVSPLSRPGPASKRRSVSPAVSRIGSVAPHVLSSNPPQPIPHSSKPASLALSLPASHPSHPAPLSTPSSSSLDMIKGMNSMFGLLPGNVSSTNPSMSIGHPSTGLSSFSSSLLSAAAGIAPPNMHAPLSSAAKQPDPALPPGYNMFMYPPSISRQTSPLNQPPVSASSGAFTLQQQQNYLSNMQIHKKSPLPSNSMNSASDIWARNGPAGLSSFSSPMNKYNDSEAKLHRNKDQNRSPIRSHGKSSAGENAMPGQPPPNPMHLLSASSAGGPVIQRRHSSADRAHKRELSVSPSSRAPHAPKILKPNSEHTKGTSAIPTSTPTRKKDQEHLRSSKDAKLPNAYPHNYPPFGPGAPPNPMLTDPMMLERARMLGMMGFPSHVPTSLPNGPAYNAPMVMHPTGLTPVGLPALSNGLAQTNNQQLPPNNLMSNHLTGGPMSNGFSARMSSSLHPAITGHLPPVVSVANLTSNSLPMNYPNPLANVPFPPGPPMPPSSTASMSEYQAAADAFKYWSSMPSFYAAAAAAAANGSVPGSVPGNNPAAAAAAMAAALAPSGPGSSVLPTGINPLSNMHVGHPIPPNFPPGLGNPFKNLHDFTRNGFLEREHLLNRYNILNSAGGGAPLTEKLAKDSAEKRVFVNS